MSPRIKKILQKPKRHPESSRLRNHRKQQTMLKRFIRNVFTKDRGDLFDQFDTDSWKHNNVNKNNIRHTTQLNSFPQEYFKKVYKDPFTNTNKCEVLTINHAPESIKRLEISRQQVLREHSGTVNGFRGQLSPSRKLPRSFQQSSSVSHVPETRHSHTGEAKNDARYRNTSAVCTVLSHGTLILCKKCGALFKRNTPTSISAGRPIARSPSNIQEYQKRSENTGKFTLEWKQPSPELFRRWSENSLKFTCKREIPTVFCFGIFRSRPNIPRQVSVREDPGTLSGFNGQCPSRRKFRGTLLQSFPGTDVQDTQPRNILSAKYHLEHVSNPGEHGPSRSVVISSRWSSAKLNHRPTLWCRTNPIQFADSLYSNGVYERLRGGGSRMYLNEKWINSSPGSRNHTTTENDYNYQNMEDDTKYRNDGKLLTQYALEDTYNKTSMESIMDQEIPEIHDHTESIGFNEDLNQPQMSSGGNEDSVRIRGGCGRFIRMLQSVHPSCCVEPIKYKQRKACKSSKKRSKHRLPPMDSLCKLHRMTHGRPSSHHLRSCSPRTRSPPMCEESFDPRSCYPHYLPSSHQFPNTQSPCSARAKAMYSHHSCSPPAPACSTCSRSQAPCSAPLNTSCQGPAMRNQRHSYGSSKDCCPCGAPCPDNPASDHHSHGYCGTGREPELPCKCRCQTCEGFHPGGGCGGQSCGRIYSCAGSGGGTCCFPRNTKRRTGPGCCGGGSRGCGGCC